VTTRWASPGLQHAIGVVILSELLRLEKGESVASEQTKLAVPSCRDMISIRIQFGNLNELPRVLSGWALAGWGRASVGPSYSRVNEMV
jgi:hypothetical protein